MPHIPQPFRCAIRAVAVMSIAFSARIGAAQQKSNSAPENISPAAWAACQEWLDACEREDRHPVYPSVAGGPALLKLLHERDADLCLLYMIDQWAAGSNRGGGPAEWSAPGELGDRNSQRTFDIVTKRLQSKDATVRGRAIELVAKFKRPETIDALTEILKHDADSTVRSKAAVALPEFKDERVIPALLEAELDPGVGLPAAEALSSFNSAKGLEQSLPFLKKQMATDNPNSAIDIVSKYRRKAAVSALLAAYGDLPRERKPATDYLAKKLVDYMRSFEFELGPGPGDDFEEWNDWWKRNEPKLTDDLYLKDTPNRYPDSELGTDPKDLEFQIALDAKTYRLKDPIRVEFTLANKGDKPHSVRKLCISNGHPAYTIKLNRGKEVFVEGDLDVSMDGTVGRYPIGTIDAHGTLSTAMCLQDLLRYVSRTPLTEGEYELEITFEPRKRQQGPFGAETVGTWRSKPVKFIVAGEARTDPQEILQLIAEKSGQKFLERYLKENQQWYVRIVEQYGDKRILEIPWLNGMLYAPLIRD